jgi:hypothetical protein
MVNLSLSNTNVASSISAIIAPRHHRNSIWISFCQNRARRSFKNSSSQVCTTSSPSSSHPIQDRQRRISLHQPPILHHQLPVRSRVLRLQQPRSSRSKSASTSIHCEISIASSDHRALESISTQRSQIYAPGSTRLEHLSKARYLNRSMILPSSPVKSMAGGALRLFDPLGKSQSSVQRDLLHRL